jgi:hypothetical protein
MTAGNVSPGSSNYIQNTGSLQAGATFYVSSGTVAGTFMVGVGTLTVTQSGNVGIGTTNPTNKFCIGTSCVASLAGLKVLAADFIVTVSSAWQITVIDGSTGWTNPTGGTLAAPSVQSDSTQGYDNLGALGTAGATLLTVAIPAGLPYHYLELGFDLGLFDGVSETVGNSLVPQSPNRIDAESPYCDVGIASGGTEICGYRGKILVSNNGTSFNVTLVNNAANANGSGYVFGFRVYGIY